jgi:hypothetical protein
MINDIQGPVVSRVATHAIWMRSCSSSENVAIHDFKVKKQV